MQRVSGLFLVYALAVHLWTVHVVNSGRLNWEVITARLQDGSSWTIYYLLFIPAVIFHAFNGMWGIVLDNNPPATWHHPLLGLFWTTGVSLLISGSGSLPWIFFDVSHRQKWLIGLVLIACGAIFI